MKESGFLIILVLKGRAKCNWLLQLEALSVTTKHSFFHSIGYMKYLPFPELESDRLVLRQLLDSDDIRIFQLRSDDTINKYINREKSIDIEQAREFIDKIKNAVKEGNAIYWAICLREDPTLIGTIGLWNFSQEN